MQPLQIICGSGTVPPHGLGDSMRALVAMGLGFLLAGCPNPGTIDTGQDTDTDGCIDADGDGACADVDCNDADGAMFPGNVEVCDFKDNDCDGTLAPFELEDADSDGSAACFDCDDDDPLRSPNLPEACDGVDNDCDGAPGPDEVDADGDGALACGPDCDDTTDQVGPHVSEICDNLIDDDCSGFADCLDGACQDEPVCDPEDCTNNVDDNGNGDVDCDDFQCVAAPVCQSTFTVVEVDANGDAGRECGIALDSLGQPHLSYRADTATTELRYATRPIAGAWATEVVDDGVFAGEWSSLSVTSDDVPVIAYHKFESLWYAENLGGTWSLEEANGFGGELVDLALDESDQPYVVHSQGDLVLVSARDSMGWTVTEVLGSASQPTFQWGEIAVNSAGNPEVGLVDSGFFQANQGTYDGMFWAVGGMDTVTDTLGDVGYALDSNDDAWFVYPSLFLNTIRMSTRVNGVWSSTSISGGGGQFVDIEVVVDEQDLPHVAFSSASTTELRYLSFDGTSWSSETIDQVGTNGDPCIAVGPNGQVVIGYYDGVLKVAEK
jgi:hypothetical protein